MTKTKGLYVTLIILLALLSTLVAGTPMLAKPMYFVVLGSAIGVLIIPRAWVTSNKGRVIIVGLLLYVFLTAFYRLIGKSDGTWGNSMHEYFFLLTFFLGVALTKRASSQQTITFWLLLCIIGVNIVYNIFISNRYPEFNLNSRDDIGEDFLRSLNVGGSTFFTMSMLLFNVCFFVFLNSKEKGIGVRIGSLFFCIIAAVFVLFYSQKGSNVVYLLLSIPLQLYAKQSKKMSNFVVNTTIVLLFVFLLFVLFKNELIQLIIDISPSERLTVRLITLLDKNNPMADTDVVSGRTDLYFLSLKTWLSNPVIFFVGIGDVRAAYDVEWTGIGQHSDFFDTLARYGLIGGLLLFATIRRYFRMILSIFDRRYKLQILVIIGIFVLCACTKGVLVPEVGCILFVILPLTSCILQHNSRLSY